MQRLRVGVLMGGKSIEREVSFNSGRTVCDHLDTARYQIVPIFQTKTGSLYLLPWHFLHRGKIADFEHRLATEAQKIPWDILKEQIDFMYLAVHGAYAEDGTLQGFLELLNIPYLGSDVFASALSMNKTMQKKFLTAQGIKVARSITVQPYEITHYATHQHAILERIKSEALSFPCIVKPEHEGSSLGITVVKNESMLEHALYNACTADPHKQQAVLIEEKIQGMEFSCITIADEAYKNFLPLPPTEIVHEPSADFFDYDQKYMPGRGEKFTPARVPTEIIKKIQDACVAATNILGISTISRIDGFVTQDHEIIIIDPNTLSGMGPASFLFREAAELNMSHTMVINHLIETELAAYGMLDSLIESEKNSATTTHKKLRVAVLLGGDSNEREISLESGRNIVYKLSPQKYSVLPIFVSSKRELYHINQSLLVRNSTKEIESLVQQTDKILWNDLPNYADFVFIGLHGGHGENGSVQGALEMLGLPYNGSGVLASALCMDKFKTTQFLQSHGFHVPRGVLIHASEWHSNPERVKKNINDTLSFPCIMKPHDDGCSVLVQKVVTLDGITDALHTLFSHGKEYALIEEYIQGMELTVGVIGNATPQALPPSQAIATGGILSIEEKFLPGAGENQTPAPLPKTTLAYVQETVAKVYGALQCRGYSRIDCFYQTAEQSPTGQERLVILEVNTLPGMTPATCIFHQAAELGIKPMDFIDLIVNFGLEEHKHTKTTESLLAYNVLPSENALFNKE